MYRRDYSKTKFIGSWLLVIGLLAARLRELKKSLRFSIYKIYTVMNHEFFDTKIGC
jgi:hypothetical protein